VLQDAEFVLVVDTVFLQVLQRGANASRTCWYTLAGRPIPSRSASFCAGPGVDGCVAGARFFFADGLAAGLLWLAPGVAAAAEVSCVAAPLTPEITPATSGGAAISTPIPMAIFFPLLSGFFGAGTGC
jgi:hypothetical protein